MAMQQHKHKQSGTGDYVPGRDTKDDRAKPGDNSGGQAVGTGVGGLSGAVTGAAIGTAIGGPAGAIIGGIAGLAVGAVSGSAIADLNREDETYWQNNFQSRPYVQQGDTYQTYADAYRFGGQTAENEQYRGKTFDEVEADIRANYEQTPAGANLAYDRARGAINDAYERRAKLRWNDESPAAVPTTSGRDSSSASYHDPLIDNRSNADRGAQQSHIETQEQTRSANSPDTGSANRNRGGGGGTAGGAEAFTDASDEQEVDLGVLPGTAAGDRDTSLEQDALDNRDDTTQRDDMLERPDATKQLPPQAKNQSRVGGKNRDRQI
jgi:uncharacterized protein YcfJ